MRKDTFRFVMLATGLLACAVATAQAAPQMQDRVFSNLPGKVLLDNERVTVTQVILPPGQGTGRRNSQVAELLVFIKGGVMKSTASARSVEWKDGRVVWLPSLGQSDDGDAINTGTTPIVMDVVKLKLVPAPATQAAAASPKYRHLNYPNIPGEDVLENDEVIVQRFLVKAGQWEGPHGHHPDMLYIHVKGGQWAARSFTEKEHVYPEPDADGSVGWMATIDPSVGHESRNAGREPIDLIWVTLKR
jgi:quercetin dioxygenase-like cupin family protein/mannose-6-phosphate isomerase-like protein (cupin superfamily)